MKYEEVEEQLDAIAERCETEEDVNREVASLSTEDKFRIIYRCALRDFEEEISDNGLGFVDWLDANQIVNDYERGCSRRQPVLGMMNALAALLVQSSAVQARQEMQSLSEGTQYGMKLAEKSNEFSVALQATLQDLIALEAHYNCVLTGRRMGVHFLDEEGTHTPCVEQAGEETEKAPTDR